MAKAKTAATAKKSGKKVVPAPVESKPVEPAGKIRLSVNVTLAQHRHIKDIAFERNTDLTKMVSEFIDALPPSSLRRRAEGQS